MTPQRTANILVRKNRKLENPAENAQSPWNFRRFFVPALLVLALAYAALAWEGIVPVSSFGLLELDRVFVSGSEKTPDRAVIFQSGLTSGMDLLGMDMPHVAHRVEELPWVAKADATRNWLDRTVTISVAEHKVAAVADVGALVYLDAEGRAFKLADSDSTGEFVVIRGLTPADLEEPPETEQVKKKNENVSNAFDIMQLYREHPLSKRAELREVLLETTGFALVVGSVPTKVIVGDDDWRRKLDRLDANWAELFLRERKPLRINMNNRNRSEKISIRFQAPKPESIEEEFAEEEVER